MYQKTTNSSKKVRHKIMLLCFIVHVMHYCACSTLLLLLCTYDKFLILLLTDFVTGTGSKEGYSHPGHFLRPPEPLLPSLTTFLVPCFSFNFGESFTFTFAGLLKFCGALKLREICCSFVFWRGGKPLFLEKFNS